MNFGNMENVLMRGVGGTPGSNGELERWSSEPEAPGFFDSSVSNKRQDYERYQMLKTEVMKQNLMRELDRANNPMSLGDVAGIVGKDADVLATSSQRSVPQYTDRVEQYKEEGPQPRGMVPIGKEVIDTVRPLTSVFSPRDLLGDNPLPEVGAAAWDQYNRRQAPYWQPGSQEEEITRDILAPGIIQGPGAPIMKERTVHDITGYKANPEMDAVQWQRDLAQAKIRQSGLRPYGNGKPSSVRERYQMLIDAGHDPDEAADIVAGASNIDIRNRQTDANVKLMGQKGENLDTQTESLKKTMGPRVNYYNQQARLAEARANDLKEMSPDKKTLLQQQAKSAKAMEEYHRHRMESGDIELAIRESKLMQALNEADRKQLQAIMKFAKDNKIEMTDAQFDQLIDNIGQGLGIQGGQKKDLPLTDRIWNTITGHGEENIEEMSIELPSQKMRREGDQGSEMRSGSIKRSNVPTKDAGDVLQEMAKELGDLTKLEGKVITDGKTKKRYRVQGGKLSEVK